MDHSNDLYKGCPVQYARQYLAGKWQMGILWNLKDQHLRFGEIKKLLPGISDKTLMQELDFFTAKKIVDRTIYDVPYSKTEYSLSDLGQSLIPVIEVIVEWGYLHLQDEKVDAAMSTTPLPAIQAIESKMEEIE